MKAKRASEKLRSE